MDAPKVVLKVENHKGDYELQNIMNIFEPYMDKNAQYKIVSRLEGSTCSAQIFGADEKLIAQEVQIVKIGKLPGGDLSEKEKKHMLRQGLKKTLYLVLSKITHQELPWGGLTGIRPTKIVHTYKTQQYTQSSITQMLIEDYCISREKAKLMMDIAEKEEQVLSKNKDQEISIYIGIPFCPTKCLYCSFTSYALDEKGQQVEAYLDALTAEINFVAKATKGRPIRSLYIGGGTPTSLNKAQLERLLCEVSKGFDIESIEEYTVEAGRPDTISREKLRLMKQYGVGRISINPQTMNQKTLDIIGRSHSVEDIVRVFDIAREEGHNNINMDLIVGLPGETPTDVMYTMERIQELSPENITVHTLAIKRASRLKETMDEYELISGPDIEQMLTTTAEGAQEMGMEPYYMYRQKDIMGNFENVGYAIPGTESIYNIQMIAEQQTIIAMGAGAVTKAVSDQGRGLERIPNVKNLEEYIKRIDEMIERKKQV